LVEHWSPKPGVGSSSLSSRANFIVMIKKFVDYCKKSYNELVYKTTWPTRSELSHSAVVVLSASLLIALIVFAMDSVFQFFMDAVYPH
jgi:preprotein translocase subunit SecE